MMRSTEKSKGGPCELLFIGLRGALIGFTLGLILAVLVVSSVLVDMRVNVGLMIPAAALLSTVLTLWKRVYFSYAFLVVLEFLLVITLIAIYGLDMAALQSVPAYLFREGLQGTDLSVNSASFIVNTIFIVGNFLWIFLSLNQH